MLDTCLRKMGGGDGGGGGKSDELGYASPHVGSKTLGQSCNLPAPQFFSSEKQKNKQANRGGGRRRKRNYNLYLAKVLGDRIFESVGYSIKDLGAPQICFSYPRGVGTCSTLPPAGPSNLTTCTRALPR